MISRRRILLRSNDAYQSDVWCDKNKLFMDHIQEVLNKWDQIDDDIWAKIIFMEKNKRVAKAYARSPVITFNGSSNGFNGYTVGLGGFDNCQRAEDTRKVYSMLGEGMKIKINEKGHILIKKLEKCKLLIRTWFDETSSYCIGDDILSCNGLIESWNDLRLFDIQKFQSNISQELKKTYPDRKKLEFQCISFICLGDNNGSLLENSCWIMIINIVALEMIKLKFKPTVIHNKTPSFVSIFDVSGKKSFQEPNIRYKELMSLKKSNVTKKWTRSNLNFGKKFQWVKVNSINKFTKPNFDDDMNEFGIDQNLEKQRDNVYYDAILNKYCATRPQSLLGNYRHQVFHPKSCGYLNSAMRKLPICSRISSCSSSDSSQTDSEAAYYHVYSSIMEGTKLSSQIYQNNNLNSEKIIKYYVGKWE